MNNAYDALMDIAEVLNLPPRALSLNSSLGLAFGARGRGGKNAPFAHYEPVKVNCRKVSITPPNGKNGNVQMGIKFIAEIMPVTFKRPSSNKKRRYNPAEYAQFKDALGFIAKSHMKGQPPLKGAIKLYAEVFKKIIPTSRTFGDWDNHGKAISDALQGICYHDDCIIVDGHVRLFKGEPHIYIELEQLT